ncbi:MAG: enoyl-CoA hydratase-related protein [Actinomycetota bacterium]|nr:enoyl-CoA hydratase-related protein [Actinomycetota bacterium]
MSGVRTEHRGPILEITLDRPKANAIDSATSRALGEVFAAFGDDDASSVAVLTGAGDRFFSAGWDLKAAVEGDTEEWGRGGFAGLTELFGLDKPVIAAVNGYAAGGGFELALACDLIVASTSATFFLPEVNLGFVPDAGGVLRLPKRLPRTIAMEMLLTGRRMGAEEAARWGLVNRVVDPGDLMRSAHELADQIASGAPLATRAVKAIVGATAEMTEEEGYAALHAGRVPAYQRALESEDANEGPRAFAEGRDPVWKGR